MLLFFLNFVFKQSLNQTYFFQHINKGKPFVIRFFDTHRKRSNQLEDNWNKYEKMYENISNINVGTINCGKNIRLCLNQSVWETPTIKIYFNNKSLQYEGGMSYESLGEWTRINTGIQGTYLQLDLQSPNSRTFNELIKDNKCVFAMFHGLNKNDKGSKYIKLLENISALYRYDNVSISEINVGIFKSFIFEYHINNSPKFYLFKSNFQKEYQGKITKHDIMDFINEFCGTQRDEQGLLNEDVGVINEVEEIVEKFMYKPDKTFIEQMELIPNTDVYVKIMENILKNAKDWLKHEYDRISVLVKSNIEQSIKDKIRIRQNVLSVFVLYL